MHHAKPQRYLITNQKVLNKDERGHLVRVCKRLRSAGDARNGLMILLTLETGMRAGELLGLRIKDFNFSSKTIFIDSLKGSNPRELPIRLEIAREIKKHLLDCYNVEEIREIEPDAPIFKICYARLAEIWCFYRPHPKKTFHSLRHTFAVDFYMKCKDLKAVQLALGHRNINNTMVYVDFSYAQSTLRKLMHG